MPINRGVDKEDVVHVHNGILLSHKKEWNNSICGNTDGPKNYHAKWSKTVRHRCHMLSFIWWNLKKGYNELPYRTDPDSWTLKNLWLPKETGYGGEGWAQGLEWKCCEIGLWWWLYNYKYKKMYWVKSPPLKTKNKKQTNKQTKQKKKVNMTEFSFAFSIVVSLSVVS